MKMGHLIDTIRRHGFDASLDGDTLLLKPNVPEAALPEAIISTIRPHKAALVALLRGLPRFTEDAERTLVDWYCNLTRAERLAVMRRGRELHAAGWPWKESDLEAMRERREAGAAP